jgi:hypothetical protein
MIITLYLSNNFNILKQSSNTSINIYPNPNDGSFTLEAQLPEDGNVSKDIYDILGNKIFSKQQYMQKGDNKLDMKLNNTGTGIYLINVKTDK